jgi:hypothetical protein
MLLVHHSLVEHQSNIRISRNICREQVGIQRSQGYSRFYTDGETESAADCGDQWNQEDIDLPTPDRSPTESLCTPLGGLIELLRIGMNNQNCSTGS